MMLFWHGFAVQKCAQWKEDTLQFACTSLKGHCGDEREPTIYAVLVLHAMQGIELVDINIHRY